MRLKLKDARVIALHIYPKEGGPNQVLEIAGLLTPPIAEKLKVRAACYSDAGTPLNYESYSSPALRIDGADISLGDKDFRADLIYKLKVVEPSTTGKKGVSLELKMKIHLGKKEAVKFWMDRQNTDEFVFGLNARQEDLSFGEEEADDEEEDVSASEDEPEDTGCVACNNDIPMGLGGFHLTGPRCTNPAMKATVEPPESEGPTLAPAVLAGGTHQKGTRGRRPARNPAAESFADGSGDDEAQPN